MINVVIAFLVGASLALGVKAAGFPWVAGIIPGTLALLGTYVVLGRRVFVKIQKLTAEVQKELQSMPPNPREQKVRVEKAIKLLESALPYGKWQFLVEGEIYSQIGVIKYMFKDLEGAQAAFAKASARNYFAKAMQAAIQYNKKDYSAMAASFEEAVKHGKKEGLMWAAYAWCLLQRDEKDRALKVLARGVQQNPSDEKLKGALTAVQNGKKLKMKGWEPMWWQLGLELPPTPQPVFAGGGRQMRSRRY